MTGKEQLLGKEMLNSRVTVQISSIHNLWGNTQNSRHGRAYGAARHLKPYALRGGREWFKLWLRSYS